MPQGRRAVPDMRPCSECPHGPAPHSGCPEECPDGFAPEAVSNAPMGNVCPACKGSGKRARMSFVDSSKDVISTCDVCRGSGMFDEEKCSCSYHLLASKCLACGEPRSWYCKSPCKCGRTPATVHPMSGRDVKADKCHYRVEGPGRDYDTTEFCEAHNNEATEFASEWLFEVFDGADIGETVNVSMRICKGPAVNGCCECRTGDYANNSKED